MSTLLVRSRKPGSEHCQQNEAENAIDLSPIQILATELKLLILVEIAKNLVMKILVIACPASDPVYCEDRYRLLLNAYRKSRYKHNESPCLNLLLFFTLCSVVSSRWSVILLLSRLSLTLVQREASGPECAISMAGFCFQVFSMACRTCENARSSCSRLEKFASRFLTPSERVYKADAVCMTVS